MSSSVRPTAPVRKAIFRDLVETQDRGVPTVDSYAEVAERHGVTVARVRAVAEEGIEKEWPPLDEGEGEEEV